HRFVAILERFARVYHVRDLLKEVLLEPAARELVIREALDVVPSAPLERELVELPVENLVTRLIEGREAEPGPLARTLNECGYALPPLPNMFFTRDAAM